MTFHGGRFRAKQITEQHADFMRLVNEFDPDSQIPCNLPSAAFHNLSKEIQQELMHMGYEPRKKLDGNVASDLICFLANTRSPI